MRDILRVRVTPMRPMPAFLGCWCRKWSRTVWRSLSGSPTMPNSDQPSSLAAVGSWSSVQRRGAPSLSHYPGRGAHHAVRCQRGARVRRFRGRSAVDIEALVQALVHISHLAVQLDGAPGRTGHQSVAGSPAGRGVKAVDALVVFKDWQGVPSTPVPLGRDSAPRTANVLHSSPNPSCVLTYPAVVQSSR